jgi:CO/xanthine dehydrogenase FAD-binding subunit
LGRYERPSTLDAALGLLAAPGHGLTVLAGATDILPAAAANAAWFRPTPDAILDISAIAGLRGVSCTGESYRIGALATWTDVIDAALPPAFDGLKQAALQVGGVQIQNRGTIGGNLCNASPAADGGPPLMALDASVELTSTRGKRMLPLAAFLLGNRKTALAADELLTAVIVPAPAEAEVSAFLKLGARAYLVISIVSVAVNARLESGRIAAARIAFGAASATPVRDGALEALVAGLTPEEAARRVSSRRPGGRRRWP